MSVFLYLRRAWVRFLLAVGGTRFLPKASIVPLPALPEGCVYVVYKQVSDPRWLNLCVKYPDGKLVPMGATEPWVPTNDWTFEKECLTGGKA